MSENNLTFEEVFEFFAEQVEKDAEKFDREIPHHAPALVQQEATALLETATSLDMATEMAEDDEEMAEGTREAELEEAVIDLFTAIATLKYEEGLDLTTAVEERIEFMKNYAEFEDAMEDAETREEQMDVMDEHMTEEMVEQTGMSMGPSAGDNVDKEDYEHEGVGRGYQ